MRARTAALVLVVAMTGSLLLAAPATAAMTGTLAGTVRDASSTPIAGIDVEVLHWYWGTVMASTTTNASGTYTVPSLAPGSYRVRFTDPAHHWADRYSGGSATWVSSTTITINASATTTLDMTMAAPALPSVRGKVTKAGGTGLGGIRVESLHWYFGVEEAATTTASDGTYSFMGLADGPHIIRFTDPTGFYGDWYSGNVADFDSSSPVTVAAGSTVTLDALLPVSPIPEIAGTVRDQGGRGVPGLTVEARDAVWGAVLATTTTGSDGRYAFLGLPAGSYRVRFVDPGGAWTTLYSGGGTTWVGSTVVTSAPGSTTTVDVVMPDLDVVNGTVTAAGGGPLAGIQVDLVDDAGATLAVTVTAANGTYSFGAVDSRAHTVRFSDPSHARATQYAGPSTTLAGAATWTFGAGVVHTVNHVMPLGGIITGTVQVGDHPDRSAISSLGWTSPNVGGLFAVVVDPTTLQVAGLASTDGTGAFSVAGLAAGTYKIVIVHPSVVTPTPGVYRPIVAPDRDVLSLGTTAALSSGTAFTVTSGGTTSSGTSRVTGWDCDPTVFHAGANLVGNDLHGKHLAGCQLPGSSLAFADLHGTDLSFADLHAANLTGANLLGSSLGGADLRHANLSGAVLFNLTGGGRPLLQPPHPFVVTSAALNGALIEDASFNGAVVSSLELCIAYPDWSGTSFSGATEAAPPAGIESEDDWHMGAPLFGHGITAYLAPGGAFFPISPSDLTSSCATPGHTFDLSRAMLSGAVLGSGWAGADLHGLVCPCTFPDGTTFAGSNLSGADLGSSQVRSGTFTGADLTGARITGATWKDPVGLTTTQARSTNHDWTGADLSGAAIDLSGLDLPGGGWQLAGAKLPGANLTGANLTGIVITGTDLTGATGLTAAQILATNHGWAGTRLGGSLDLHGVSFATGGFTLTNASLAGANLAGASFAGMNLTNLDLTGANLTGANFTGATITGVSFTNATGLTLAQLASTGLSLTGISLPGVDLSNQTFGAVNLTGCDLSGVRFTNSDLSNVNLTGCNLAHADFTGATLTNATIANASLAGATGLTSGQVAATNKNWGGTRFDDSSVSFAGFNFTGYTVGSAHFARLDLHGANLAVRGLIGADFTGANLTGTAMWWSDLTAAKLTGANLTNATLNASALSVATLTGANLTGANLTGARADGASFADAVGLTRSQVLSLNHNWSSTVLAGTGVDLSGVDFAAGTYTLVGADLSGLNLSAATLTGRDLTNASFAGTNLSGANVTGAVFAGSMKLAGANLSNAVGLTGVSLFASLDWTNLDVANTGVDLSGKNLGPRGSQMTGMNLTGANLTNATFGDPYSSPPKADLTGVVLSGATITGADLRNTTNLLGPTLLTTTPNWTGTQLPGWTSFAGADLAGTGHVLTGADLTGADLTGANLTGLNLAGTRLAAANATNATFTAASLVGTDLSYAKLTGATMTGAVLSTASLTEADFSGATGTPTGGSTASYLLTVCPDATVTNGSTQLSCVGHGFAA